MVLLLLAAGCGTPEPELFPLAGRVLYRGRPVAGAELGFHPLFEGPGWSPVAVTGEDGSFQAATKQPGDGVLPGRYKVTVVWHPETSDGEESPNRLPARYASPVTSDLEVEAGTDSDTPFTFELKD